MTGSLNRRLQSLEQRMHAKGDRLILIYVVHGTPEETVDAFVVEHVGPARAGDLIVCLQRFGSPPDTPPVSDFRVQDL